MGAERKTRNSPCHCVRQLLRLNPSSLRATLPPLHQNALFSAAARSGCVAALFPALVCLPLPQSDLSVPADRPERRHDRVRDELRPPDPTRCVSHAVRRGGRPFRVTAQTENRWLRWLSVEKARGETGQTMRRVKMRDRRSDWRVSVRVERRGQTGESRSDCMDKIRLGDTGLNYREGQVEETRSD